MVEVHEKYDSRKASDNSREYSYIISGTDNELEALNAAPGALYISIPNLRGDSYSPLRLQKKVTVEQVIAGSDADLYLWTATVRYDEIDSSASDEDDEDQINYSLSVTTSTVNVKRAIGEPDIFLPPEGTMPPELRGRENWIGVTRNGNGILEAQGVDTLVPNVCLEIEKKFPRKKRNVKIKQICHKCGMVNSDKFDVFDEEEALLQGARLSYTGGETISISFQFLISHSHKVNVPGIGEIDKKGWRYLWTVSGLAKDGISEAYTAAISSRTYLRTTFASLFDKAIGDDAPKEFYD